MRKKCKKKFLASLKPMKKGIVSGVGSGTGYGSITQRYGSGDPDPDPQQNVMDPKHWIIHQKGPSHEIF